MSAVVAGFVNRPEGWAALEAAVGEARLRDSRLLVVHSGECEAEQRDEIESRVGAWASAPNEEAPAAQSKKLKRLRSSPVKPNIL